MSSEERREPTEGEKPVVRDRRRIDPETGRARDSEETRGPAAAGSEPAQPPANGQLPDELAKAQEEAAERLEDLKRLQAEYVNYRRRVERDREAVREAAKVEVLGGLLDVLDDVGRARDHGDLTGGFRSVGESLEAATSKAGLVRYGEPGDVFDPNIHEALMHSYSDEVTEVTCVQILQPGYRVGDRVLRPARVAVAEPTESLPPADNGSDTMDNSSESSDTVQKSED